MYDRDETKNHEETISLTELDELDGAENPSASDGEYADNARELNDAADAQSEQTDTESADEESFAENAATVASETENAEEGAEIADNGVIDGDKAEAQPEPAIETEPSAEEEKADKRAFYDSAKVFGVSEGQLENEFKTFKAGKLFTRINLTLNDPFLSIADFKNMLTEAYSMGLGSVSVYPNRLAEALKTVGSLMPVYALVSYPYATDDQKSRLFTVKKLAKTGIAGVEIPLNVTELSEKRPKMIAKEYKRLKWWLGGKKELVLVIEMDRLTPADIGAFAKVCKEAGITKVKTSCALANDKIDEYLLNNLRVALGENVGIIAATAKGSGEEVVSVFASGAKEYSTPHAVSVATEIKDTIQV